MVSICIISSLEYFIYETIICSFLGWTFFIQHYFLEIYSSCCINTLFLLVLGGIPLSGHAEICFITHPLKCHGISRFSLVAKFPSISIT
jgi:hypothetical protein